ncbi:uncharacterized protein LOC102801146 [Saccoglossus kowalevskii]|uniref:Uncharacterized protein LOC102801146 n=1 Tax=Saccoglossus kowalevskii TaxID=10224 RepID=A0ABM0LZQ9_SACKO|nr:PREDICTED: uncharacterized protein LOC102801146 [Saccoglossus kowalevskii]
MPMLPEVSVDRYSRRKRKAPFQRNCSVPILKRQKHGEPDLNAASVLLELSTLRISDDSSYPVTSQNVVTIRTQTDPVVCQCTKVDVGCQTVYDKYMLQFVNHLTYWKESDKKGDKTKLKNKKTNPIDELFMTLVRLRRGYCFYTMTFFLKFSESWIRCIFTTWLQLLYCHFNDIRKLMFPDRTVLRKFMPKSFPGFKNVRCSVDCTEFFVQMPRDFARQGNLYSNYKHHHTFKCLIAVAPNGTGVFISPLYEGAISDRDIFEQCGILKYLNPNDLLLVDCGFTVEDLLMSQQVDMNIPPFLKGRDKLTQQEELLTRKIAKARIHVERFNKRIKRFRLISGIIPLSLAPVASQAVFVACCLVDFQDQLAK